MTDDKLRVQVVRMGQFVLVRVLSQPEQLRADKTESRQLWCVNGFEIKSCEQPQIDDSKLYIRGSRRDRDTQVISVRLDSEKAAAQLVCKIQDGVRAINNRPLAPMSTTTPEAEVVNIIVE